MLTLPQIIKKANRLRKENSKYVRIIDVKKGYNTLGQGFIASASYSTHIIGPDGRPHANTSPNRYVTVITFLDRKLHVSCACSCDDFKYRWEWALNSKGAADIEYSNGESPDSTNPTYKSSCCVAKGTYVTVDTGLKRIEDVSVGDEVLTLSGYKKVTASGLTRESADILTFQTSSKRKVSVTPDHRVLVLKSGNLYPSWIEASEIVNGDHLVSVLPVVNTIHEKLNPLALLRVLPQLSKYSRKRRHATNKSRKEDVWPVDVNLVRNELKILIRKDFPILGKDSVVPARHYYDQHGWVFGDGNAGRFMTEVVGARKLKVDGIDKPLVAARKSSIQKFFFDNLGYKQWIKLFPELQDIPGWKSDIHVYLHALAAEHPYLLGSLRKLFRFTAPDVVYEKVTSIRESSGIDAYDLTVADTPHFLANGFVVHNCKHLVALFNKKLAGKIPGL